MSEEEEQLKKAKKKEFAMKEIVSTEITYIERLKILIEYFIQPLKESKILNNKEIDVQFSLLTRLFDLHKDFTFDINEINLSEIIKLFEVLSENFIVYSDYLVNFEPALNQRGQILSSNRKFAEYLEGKMKDPRLLGQSLESFFILPVQRIPRYRLLLEQLLKYITEEDEGYEQFKRAHNAMCDMALYSNEAIRARENKEKIMEIMLQFDSGSVQNLLDDDSRRFLLGATLLKQCRRGFKEFRFWLFSDQLLYGEKNPIGKYFLNRKILLSKCFISNAKDNVNSFLIQSPAKSFVVQTRDEKEKKEWIDAINDAIQRNRESFSAAGVRMVAPLWTPDAERSTCQKCDAMFSLIFRRHHCRSCGDVVCDNCSTHRFLLLHLDTKKEVRVCDACYKTLSGGSEIKRRSSTSTIMKSNSVGATPIKSLFSDVDSDQDSEDEREFNNSLDSLQNPFVSSPKHQLNPAEDFSSIPEEVVQAVRDSEVKQKNGNSGIPGDEGNRRPSPIRANSSSTSPREPRRGTIASYSNSMSQWLASSRSQKSGKRSSVGTIVEGKEDLDQGDKRDNEERATSPSKSRLFSILGGNRKRNTSTDKTENDEEKSEKTIENSENHGNTDSDSSKVHIINPIAARRASMGADVSLVQQQQKNEVVGTTKEEVEISKYLSLPVPNQKPLKPPPPPPKPPKPSSITGLSTEEALS